MKNIIALSSAVGAIVLGLGFAHAADTSFDLTASAPSVCVIPGAGTNVAITLTGLVNATTGLATAIDQELATYTNAYCTFKAKVKATSTNGALTLGDVLAPALGVAPGGFANLIKYNGVADWASGSLIATVNANGLNSGLFNESAETPTALMGNLVVKVQTTAGANPNPLVGGSYGDILTVQLIPTV